MGISIKIGGGAASIPAASTTTEGKVRLATNTEAVTGTATDIAVTPAGVAAALAGIVGGMTYKGFWDAVNAVPDLSNAKQGDFYYVSAAGTRYGKEWAVGDHLVVNANMGGTIDGAKIDKIDSTESISALGDLVDVVLTSPSEGQALTYDYASSTWINTTLDIGALQTELDDTQVGAGLGSDGAYTPPTSSNYLESATSLKSADSLLDAQLKLVADDVATLGGEIVTSVNSIAPVTGNVTLTATDISGFATVATSGLYSDLTGSPVLATVATSGLYSDLTGSPVLATVATSGAAGDVSVAATPVNYTAASPDVEAHLAGIDTVLGTLGGEIVSTVNGITPVVGDVTVTAQDIDTNHTAVNYTAAGASVTEHIAGIDGELGTIDTALQAVVSDVADLTANRLHASIEFVNNGVNDVQAGIDAATASNTLVWCSPGTYGGATVTITNKELLKLRAEGCGTGAFGIVELTARGITISGASSTRNLVQGFQVEGLTTINGTQGRHAFVDCQLLGGLTITNGTANFVTIRDCDIVGTVTIAASVTATIYFINCNFAAGASISNEAAVGQVIVANCGGFPAAALTSVTMAGQSGLSDGSFRGFFSALSLPAALSFTGNTNQLTNGAGFITAASAPVTSVNTLTGAVTLTGQNTNTNHTAVNYTAATTALTSHLAGIDTVLGTLGESVVATVNGIAPVGGDVTVTAADITGFAAVATSGAYADLGGLPTLGTAAALDVGTNALNIVQLDASARLPAVDGSQLTNLPAAVSYVYSAQTSSFNAAVGYHYSVNTTAGAVTASLPALPSPGAEVRFKLYNNANSLTILPNGTDTIDGAASVVLAAAKQAITLVAGSSDWEVL